MDPIELEEATDIRPMADGRPRMDELPPVRLVAVEDVRTTTPPGQGAALDAFYVGLLQFRREADEIVYRAENVRLRVAVSAGPLVAERGGVRPVGIEVPSLADVEQGLIEAEVEYDKLRGLLPGQLSLLLRDPAGNWVELFESPVVR